MRFSTPEILLVVAIAVVLFGSRFLPKLARSVGDARREFRASTEE
jgi:TatA/E family protein of Tat protein translocase